MIVFHRIVDICALELIGKTKNIYMISPVYLYTSCSNTNAFYSYLENQQHWCDIMQDNGQHSHKFTVDQWCFGSIDLDKKSQILQICLEFCTLAHSRCKKMKIASCLDIHIYVDNCTSW